LIYIYIARARVDLKCNIGDYGIREVSMR
jgi:hypothetical protein